MAPAKDSNIRELMASGEFPNRDVARAAFNMHERVMKETVVMDVTGTRYTLSGGMDRSIKSYNSYLKSIGVDPENIQGARNAVIRARYKL